MGSDLTTDEQKLLRELQLESRELKRSNEIQRKAPASFAQAELGRKPLYWLILSMSTVVSTRSLGLRLPFV